MTDFTKTLFLLNPISNEKKALKKWQKAVAEFNLPENPFLLTQIKNLKEFIQKNDPELIVVAGGDGSINSVCAAIFELENKPKVAILPLGFGNALSYCFGVENLKKAVNVLNTQKHTVTIDLIKTNLKKYPIGVFNISTGMDARIVHDRMNHRYIGIRSYLLSSIKTAVSHNNQTLDITIDETTNMSSTATSLVIANSPVIGHNFVISPQARVNDGYLDCTLFSSKYDYFRNLRFKGFKHPLYSETGKVHLKAKKIRVTGDRFVQVDGEPILQTNKPLELEILPSSITFVTAAPNKIKQKYIAFDTLDSKGKK